MKQIGFGAIFLASMTLASASQATTFEYHSYGVERCRAATPSDNQYLQYARYDVVDEWGRTIASYTGLANRKTTGAVTVDCPLPMDFSWPDTTKITDVTVFIWDRNATANVQCVLRRNSHLGNENYSYTLNSSGSTTGPIGYSFSNLGSPNSAEWYSMRCSIPKSNPADSMITGIRISAQL